MPNDHPSVAAELERRSRSNQKVTTSASWKDQHSNLAEQYGVKWPLDVPQTLSDSPWFKVLPDREKEARARSGEVF